MKKRGEPLLVIGMHRSGTSMLSRFIEESGVFMGKKSKMGPNNEAFFFQRINEWLLYQKGANWDRIENLNFQSDFANLKMESAVRSRLQNCLFTRDYLELNQLFFHSNLLECDLNWGWKDPKTTLLLDIWCEIFPDARIIHIYRNPIDVAQSLSKREEIIEENYKYNYRIKKKEILLSKKPCYNQSIRIKDLTEGVKLWKDYVNRALDAQNYFKNVIHIGYEDFLQRPKEVLAELANFMEITPSEEIIDSIASKTNPNRSFAFQTNEKLIELYHSIKEDELMKKLNYNSVL